MRCLRISALEKAHVALRLKWKQTLKYVLSCALVLLVRGANGEDFVEAPMGYVISKVVPDLSIYKWEYFTQTKKKKKVWGGEAAFLIHFWNPGELWFWDSLIVASFESVNCVLQNNQSLGFYYFQITGTLVNSINQDCFYLMSVAEILQSWTKLLQKINTVR